MVHRTLDRTAGPTYVIFRRTASVLHTQPKLFRYKLRISVVALPINILLPHNQIFLPPVKKYL